MVRKVNIQADMKLELIPLRMPQFKESSEKIQGQNRYRDRPSPAELGGL
jgi:hypothetical protein